MTDNEIIKGKELIEMLQEAYNAYYDTSKGMPYNIDEILRESAFCLENCLNEINRLQAENEKKDRAFEELIKVARLWKEKYNNAKADHQTEKGGAE